MGPYVFLQPLVHNLGLGLAYQKTTFSTKIGGGLCQGSIQKKFGTPYFFMQLLKLATSNLVHKLGLGLAHQKMTFKTQIGGVWARGASKKIGTPYLFLLPLKLASSNLVRYLGMGLAYQNTMFRTKIGGGLGQGSIQKNVGPIRIFATVEGVHNLGLGLAYQKTTGPKLAGVWARGASKKIWDSLFISATDEARD